MSALLDGAEFGDQTIDEQQAKQLTDEGQSLLDEVSSSATP
jgi:hypothetical protein